jgi:hypothetical protein
MIDIPRGKYLGKRLGAPPRARLSTSSVARPAAGGLIAAILAKLSSTKGRYRIRRRIGRNDQEETPL